jgi:hypothetical protein
MSWLVDTDLFSERTSLERIVRRRITKDSNFWPRPAQHADAALARHYQSNTCETHVEPDRKAANE